MGIFGKKKTEEVKESDKKAEVKVEKKSEEKIEGKPVEKKEVKASEKKEIKGKTNRAHKILIKPVITEKAANIGMYNKYVFEVAIDMNKVEVKKAVRAVYGVDPISVNIINVSGKKVRYGRKTGSTKNRKKAVVTLKEGESIEVYEGV